MHAAGANLDPAAGRRTGHNQGMPPGAVENDILAVCALHEAASRGRRYPEPAHPYRGEFQRDRDRIIHSRAFRRLENKTQVFSRRFSDHFRTRMTHTLEVAQVSRTVGRALGLNRDLVEALALAHDLGHSPFGHAGEHALDQLMRQRGGEFDHNLQAVRLVEALEVRYAEFPGLNLTFEVREGLVKHSHDYDPAQHPELAEYNLALRPPLEAQLIDLTDEISYGAADLDDGFEARLLRWEDLRHVPLLAEMLHEVQRLYPQAAIKLQFNETLKRVLDYFVSDLIVTLGQLMPQWGSSQAVRHEPQRVVRFSAEAEAHRVQLKAFLYRELYHHPHMLEENRRAEGIVVEVFEHFERDPATLPAGFRSRLKTESPARVICDYIAGMTDSYISHLHASL